MNKVLDEFLVPNQNFERLMTEYKRYGSLTIGFDFDGTVHDYHKTGASHEMVRQLLRDLKKIGCKLVCWTAYEDIKEYVPKFLKDNDIPCDCINEGGIQLPWQSKKPFFSALLDDRAGLAQAYIELRTLADIVLAGGEENVPYITKIGGIKMIKHYNPKYGNERICECGHTYYRHFDTYENMQPVGCKYCPCFNFKEKQDESTIIS